MDIRVLRYFLTVAREESFSRAAESLYLSQPTLSRQIRDLEEELGVALFIRTNRNVVLTKEGMRLRKRAQEIVELMDKTRSEFADLEDEITGDVYIGSGETRVMRQIARSAIELRQENPGIRYHLYSGNSEDVLERLEKGLLDFGLLIGVNGLSKFDVLHIPGKDTWGLLMPAGHPLTQKEAVTAADLTSVPLLVSRQTQAFSHVQQWFGTYAEHMNVACTYNLLYNAAIMVEQGMGCALTLDGLVNAMDVNGLSFRPLYPTLEEELLLVWKKYQIFSPAAELFLQRLQANFADNNHV